MEKSPDPVAFVETLAPALRQAASIARALEGRVANRPKPGEATEVKAALTVADTASQEAILVPLHENFPGVRVEAEEATPAVELFPTEGDSLVVVDPIDGTLRFYLEGLGPYAVLVGLALRGEYTAALVALPNRGFVLHATRGGGSEISVDDGPSVAARAEANGRLVYVSHDLPEPAIEHLRSHDFDVAPACGGAISVAPVLPGVRAGLRLAREPAVVSIRGRIGALISREAGALVRSETGDDFPAAIEAPGRALMVAADPADLAILEEALARSGEL